MASGRGYVRNAVIASSIESNCDRITSGTVEEGIAAMSSVFW